MENHMKTLYSLKNYKVARKEKRWHKNGKAAILHSD